VRFDRGLATEASYRYFLEETTAPALFRILPEGRSSADHIALMAGPEGGWLDAERQAAAAAHWQPASLGPLVLRAETAATAAIAVLMNAWL
jgi:16S rRNA (uracil1498-N3)-methyltransferase